MLYVIVNKIYTQIGIKNFERTQKRLSLSFTCVCSNIIECDKSVFWHATSIEFNLFDKHLIFNLTPIIIY